MKICLGIVLGILLSTSSVVNGDLLNFFPRFQASISLIRDVKDGLTAPVTKTTQERTFTDYYFGGHKYAMVSTDNETGKVLDCILIGDREFIAYMIGDKTVPWSGPILALADESPYVPFINITTDLIDDFIDKCNGEYHEEAKPPLQNFFAGLARGPQTILKFAAVFPGTKWCGPGNVARNYDDLGRMAGTDKCCRDHDHAIESIPRGGEKYNLTNNLLYTMTKCPDDTIFNTCLHDEGTLHSAAVGTTFFNILKTKCFDKRKKARCTARLLSGLTPCTSYTYDENSKETWQIFDAMAFVPNSSLPMRRVNRLLHSLPGFGDVLTLI